MTAGCFPDIPFKLSICSEIVFTDLAPIERIRRIAQAGFEVEIWNWANHDLKVLAATGATFGSMMGYQTGTLSDEEGAEEMVRTARQSVVVAKDLGIGRLVLHGTGLDANGLPVVPCPHPTGGMWLKARDTLNRLADIAEEAGVTFVLENLNPHVDHPGVPFGAAADTLALVASVDRPGVRMLLDLYHAQIGEGNLIELCRKALPYIGAIQVADVPGRCEPGTGEIHYPAIARALHEMGYSGPVGLEAFASGDSDDAMDRFRTAFVVPQ